MVHKGRFTHEWLIWFFIAAGVFTAALNHYGTPGASNDGYQYLSTAENILERHSVATSIIFYDSERSHGMFPAPLTTFPAGYPLSIAAVTASGLQLEAAACLISILSFASVAALFWKSAEVIAVSPWVARMLLIVLIGNSVIVSTATGIDTESLFTAVSLGAVTLLLRAEAISYSVEAKAPPAFIAGVFLVGIAYWVRYAGLFLFLAVSAYCILRCLIERRQSALNRLVWLSLPLAMIGAGVIRNHVLTGSWKGGNTKAVIQPLSEAAGAVVNSLYHVTFGLGRISQIRIGNAALLIASAAVLIALAIKHRASLTRACAAYVREFGWPLLLLASYIAIYSFGMVYLSAYTCITMGARLIVPLFPFQLLAAAAILTLLSVAARKRLFIAALIAGGMGCILVHWPQIAAPRPMAPHQLVLNSFARNTNAGQPLLHWFQSSVASGAVIVASSGQGTAYALSRPTVGLIESQFCECSWEEAEVREVMHRFGASYLILYRGHIRELEPVQQESAFLKGVMEGRVPGWLRVAAENPEVTIFHRADDVIAGPGPETQAGVSASTF